MIIVSKSKIPDKNTKEERLCKYSDVPTDEDKWVYDLTNDDLSKSEQLNASKIVNERIVSALRNLNK